MEQRTHSSCRLNVDDCLVMATDLPVSLVKKRFGKSSKAQVRRAPITFHIFQARARREVLEQI